jgi:hypothetical protein
MLMSVKKYSFDGRRPGSSKMGKLDGMKGMAFTRCTVHHGAIIDILVHKWGN